MKTYYTDFGKLRRCPGADDVPTAIKLQRELDGLFCRGGFTLHKWNSNESSVLQHIDPSLQDARDSQEIAEREKSTKTLGLEWVTNSDEFRLTISTPPSQQDLTKRILVSDIAQIFDTLGWFSPSIIMMKTLLQRFWEEKIDWDDAAPSSISDVWHHWREELPILKTKGIPRCYFSRNSLIVSRQLHGFSDASETAYAAVVYMRTTDSQGEINTSLVTSKTKVSPIKRQTIPRLELCGALLLAKLLDHTQKVLRIPLVDTHAWTDSTVVLSWLTGNPRRFKTFVGNRVSQIVDLIPPDRWKHVAGVENPADCASRGLFPSELIDYCLWWDGPIWLKYSSTEWPQQPSSVSDWHTPDSASEVCHLTNVPSIRPMIVTADRYSSFDHLRRVISWVIRFIHNCRSKNARRTSNHLITSELYQAENHIFTVIQSEQFPNEIGLLRSNHPIPKDSRLIHLSPFVDPNGLLRVGGRQRLGHLSYSKTHPIILHGNHPTVKLLILSEHKRLLHGGPTLIFSSLSQRFHIIRGRTTVRSIVRNCVTCRRQSMKPTPPILGQLPTERITPDAVFNKTGIDYAGPIYVKYGHVRKPVIVKSYVCVFVSLNVKAVHLELVSSLSSEAFISCLRRFIARRGYPSLLWSDHGSNFIGANREIKELIDLLKEQKVQGEISEFCTARHIDWKFIPEHSPHFGGIWEAAVKSFKKHLKKIVGESKLTFEETNTVLSQIEACLNSRPLTIINNPDDDGLEPLTLGHFLIGKPLMALPDPTLSCQSTSIMRRWQLCQTMVNHFWKRWSLEYLVTLQRGTKWHQENKNLVIGDVVVVIEDKMIPTQWPMARIVGVHPGKDGAVRVVDIKTSTGIYRRPVHKVAKLLPMDN